MNYALIGEKLGHSMSKWVHERLASHPYELSPLARDEVGKFLCERDFLGINVTIPY